MGNFIVSGAAVRKAGSNIDQTIPEAGWTEWISGAESFINVATGYNWSDVYASLNDDVKFILYDTAANLVAIHAITYNMSGATTAFRIEREDRINVLAYRANQNLKALKEMGSEKFMRGA